MSMRDKSPYFVARQKSVRDIFDEFKRESLTPWVFFNVGKPINIKNRQGREVHYEGVKFEGSPRDVFWSFFTPCIEDIISEQFEAAIEICTDDGYFHEDALTETADLLRSRVTRFLRDMAEIDQRIRGEGFPEHVPRRPVDNEIGYLNEIIEQHLGAAKQRISQRKDLAKRSSKAPASSDGLDPTPPKLLQHIAWFRANWRSYKRLIFVGALVMVLAGGINYGKDIVDLWNLVMAGEATTLLLVGEPSNTEASKKNTSPALRVRFRDGTVAFVNMSLSVQLDVDSLLEAHRLYGNQERMDAELMDAVRGAAYKALERMTVNEARLRRGDVGAIAESW